MIQKILLSILSISVKKRLLKKIFFEIILKIKQKYFDQKKISEIIKDILGCDNSIKYKLIILLYFFCKLNKRYEHLTVNHYLHFVDPDSNCYINGVESICRKT